MVFSYYGRLTRAQQRTYRRSDGITRVALPDAAALAPLVEALEKALALEDRHRTVRACQSLAEALLGALKAPPLRVEVLAARPSNHWGELHGLYTPSERDRLPRITLWMRTAQRRRVVAFRTFLRTLLHELCHHLDYELFGLDETFHTEGFYKRESSLLYQLAGKAPGKAPAKPPSPGLKSYA